MLKVLDAETGGLKPFCSVRWSSLEGDHTENMEEQSNSSPANLRTLFQVG